MKILSSFLSFMLLFFHSITCLPVILFPDNSSKIEEPIDEIEDKSLIKVEDHNYTYYWYKHHQRSFWINITDVQGPIATVLKDSYLYGHPIHLPDYFIFYGHRIRDVLVTTGGFLYMDEMTHRQLTYSQYIAPLMANFETKSATDVNSSIKFFVNSTMLIIWWNDMRLKHSINGKRFTFQLVYYNNGSMYFNYDQIPKDTFQQLKNGDSMHKVTVGLADAYYLFEDMAMHMKVVFEYHQLSIPVDDVLQYKSIEIKPLPNCIEQTTCESCTSAKISTRLNCQWCPTAHLCSDGFDRMRQKWLEHDCSDNGFVDDKHCTFADEVTVNSSEVLNLTLSKVKASNGTDDDYDEKIMALKNEIKFSIVLLICGVVLFFALWILYAVKYPNSASGRWLIEHRPTKLFERCRRCWMSRVGHRGRTETYVSFDREMNNDIVL